MTVHDLLLFRAVAITGTLALFGVTERAELRARVEALEKQTQTLRRALEELRNRPNAMPTEKEDKDAPKGNKAPLSAGVILDPP